MKIRILSIPVSIWYFIAFSVLIVSAVPGSLWAQQTVYFPHIASNSIFETELCLINSSYDDNLTGDLTTYTDGGTEVETISLTFSPNERKQFTVGSFTTPGDIGYAVFETDGDSARGYQKFYRTGMYRVAIPAVLETTTGDLYISHIASTTDACAWVTGISLLNTTGTAKNLTIEFDNGVERTCNLNPHEHKAFTVKSFFGEVSQPDIHCAVIKNADGVVGLELFTATALNWMSGILLKNDTADTIYYPHSASNDVWSTGIVAYNPSAGDCTMTVTPYTEAGTPLAAATPTVAGKSQYQGTVKRLGLPGDTAWLKIDATTPITGFELFAKTNQLGGYTGVGIAAKNGVFPKIETDGWTGIAFVNVENAPATVQLIAFNDGGGTVAFNTYSLTAYEKKVDGASNFFAQGTWNGDFSDATYIGYTADRDVVGFQLNGTWDNLFLDALPALATAEDPLVFEYAMNRDAGDPDPFTAQAGSGEPVTVTASSMNLEGTYNPTTEETSIDVDSTLSMDTTQDLYGVLDIRITTCVAWALRHIPTAGGFAVTQGADTIQVDMNPDVGGGVAGVDITDGTSSASLTWQVFSDVENSETAPAYQQVAWFAFAATQYIYEHAWYAFKVFQTVTRSKTALQAAGSGNPGVTETCGEFPPGSGVTGTREYVWVDGNSSGILDSGDDYHVTYNTSPYGCWYDEPNNDIDTLITGILELNNFITVETGGMLTSAEMDVVFNDFVERETEGSVVLTEWEGLTQGGFNLTLSPVD